MGFSWDSIRVGRPGPPARLGVPPAPPVTIGSAAPASGRATVPYTSALQASGGQGTYRWSVTAGALPGGLALDAATGAISGIPSVAGTSSFTVTAADALDPENA